MKQIRMHQNKVLTLTDQTLVSGVNFLTGILLARFLGVELYGVFALGWMVVFFASGLQQAFVISPMYALSAKQENQGEWFRELCIIQLLISGLAGFVLCLMICLLVFLAPEWGNHEAGFALAGLVPIFMLNDFFRRLHFVKNNPARVLRMDLLGYGLQPLVLCALQYAEMLSVTTAILAILVAQLLGLIAAAPSLEGSQTDRSRLLTTIKTLWKYSRYLIGTSVLQWFSGNYFILAAGAILGPATVGAIRIAQNLMGVLNVLLLAMENILPARAAETFRTSGNTGLVTYLRASGLKAMLPIGLLILCIGLFRGPIIAWVYGAEFIAHSNLLLGFCAIYLLVFPGTILRFYIRTIEQNHLIFWSYVFTTGFSVLLAHPMVAQWGATGVILGIAGTHVLSLSFFLIILKNKQLWSLTSSM